MIGIINYSTYVPRRRLRRETVAAAWGTSPMPGCKAVVNFDEDSLTMAQSAAWPLAARLRPNALSFASTTSPYWQRSAASLIAAACDLPANRHRRFRRIPPRRHHRSARRARCRRGRHADTALVAAADCREGAPESAEEMLFGDAAAAVAVGRENLAAELVASVSRSDDFPDEWRRDTDPHVHSFASKYSLTRGYAANVEAVGRALFAKAGVSRNRSRAPCSPHPTAVRTSPRPKPSASPPRASKTCMPRTSELPAPPCRCFSWRRRRSRSARRSHPTGRIRRWRRWFPVTRYRPRPPPPDR